MTNVATKNNLTKGAIIKDNLLGLIWEVVNPTMLGMK